MEGMDWLAGIVGRSGAGRLSGRHSSSVSRKSGLTVPKPLASASKAPAEHFEAEAAGVKAVVAVEGDGPPASPSPAPLLAIPRSVTGWHELEELLLGFKGLILLMGEGRVAGGHAGRLGPPPVISAPEAFVGTNTGETPIGSRRRNELRREPVSRRSLRRCSAVLNVPQQ